MRFISELAWQEHFVHNMFIRTEGNTDDGVEPDFTIINACKISAANWKELGLKSEVFVAFNIEKKLAVIGGTWYGGEMKKVNNIKNCRCNFHMFCRVFLV